MASKLKSRKKPLDNQNNPPERRPSCSNEEGDEFPASTIATKIHSRRLPRRTPTTHVKTGQEVVKKTGKTSISASKSLEEEEEKSDDQKKTPQNTTTSYKSK